MLGKREEREGILTALAPRRDRRLKGSTGFDAQRQGQVSRVSSSHARH